MRCFRLRAGSKATPSRRLYAPVAGTLALGVAVLAFGDDMYVVGPPERVAMVPSTTPCRDWLNQGKTRGRGAPQSGGAPPGRQGLLVVLAPSRPYPRHLCGSRCRKNAAGRTPCCSASRPSPTCSQREPSN